MFSDQSIRWWRVSADDVVAPAEAPPIEPR
jgi:hypothetical protein